MESLEQMTGIDNAMLAMLLKVEAGHMLPHEKLKDLPMESACTDCGTYRNPETGKHDPSYNPTGRLGFDYQLSHGICEKCTSNYIIKTKSN